MKSGIWVILENLSKKTQIVLESDKNKGRFTRGATYIYGHITLNPYLDEK
jgi:hypothetical protein